MAVHRCEGIDLLSAVAILNLEQRAILKNRTNFNEFVKLIRNKHLHNDRNNE